MLCPECGQDDLLVVEIAPHESIIVCPECEASWKEVPDFEGKYSFQLGPYLRGKGIENDWTKFRYHKVSTSN